MSQDHDREPLDATRQFQPIDPYNIGPDTAGAPLPGYEDGYAGEQGAAYGTPGAAAGDGGAPGQSSRGLKQRLGRLGAPKLAALGAGLVIVIGGAAWGTSAALASSDSSSAPQAQGQGQVPAGPGATTGTGKKGKNAAKAAARVKITKVDAGSFTGTEAKGKTVTVVYGDDTKFGTKARPLSADQLQAGMTVTVAGTRAGDKITAVLIAEPMKKAGGTTGGEPTTSGPSPSSSGSSTESG